VNQDLFWDEQNAIQIRSPPLNVQRLSTTFLDSREVVTSQCVAATSCCTIPLDIIPSRWTQAQRLQRQDIRGFGQRVRRAPRKGRYHRTGLKGRTLSDPPPSPLKPNFRKALAWPMGQDKVPKCPSIRPQK